MVVLVLNLEVIMNNIGIDEEDNLGSSVGSFGGINYVKKPVGSLLEISLIKVRVRMWGDQDEFHESEE